MNHTIIHFEIPGDDPKALADFYANLFGWKVQDASALWQNDPLATA